MSRDFSPQIHWFAHKQYPDIHMSNIEFEVNGKKWMRFSDEELADRRKHEYVQVLASDIYSEIRSMMSDKDFENFNIMLKNLVTADEEKKDLSSFPKEVVTWYRNDNNHYYHEPNDEEFLEYLQKTYVKEKKSKSQTTVSHTKDDFER